MDHKKEALTIDTNIETSSLGTILQIHPKICTPLPKHTNSSSTKPFCSKISQIEAQLSAFRSYVSCEISSLHSKIKLILQSFQEKHFRKDKAKLMKSFIRIQPFYRISS